MMKAHCDNCDALITNDANPARRLTLQPRGFQCLVTVKIQKEGQVPEHVLCVNCLHTAVIGFAESLVRVGWGDKREKSGG